MQESHPARRDEPFLFATATSDRFELALAQAAQHNARSMAELRSSAEECMVSLRNEGMECEAALITLKAYVQHVARSQRASMPVANAWAAELLMEQIVRWSIMEFYRVE